MSTYQAYVNRLRATHGTKFDESGLCEKFRAHFGERIEVIGLDDDSRPRRGIVAGTTGWRPALMLLKRRDSMRSSDLLSDQDRLVRVIPKKRRF